MVDLNGRKDYNMTGIYNAVSTSWGMEKELEQIHRKDVIRVGVDSTISKLLWRRLQKMVDAFYSEEDFQFSKIDRSVGNSMLGEHSLDIYIGYGMDEEYREEDIEEFTLSEQPIGVYVGKDTTIHSSGTVVLEELKGYVRYGTRAYPCSVVEDLDKTFYDSCRNICYVDNAETMKIKVEFNDGYAFVDSYYFSQCSGEIYLLSDWKCPQCMKVYYRRNSKKKKLGDVLAKLKQIAEET